MRKHGITFNVFSEKDARTFLSRSSYYFKIKSYRHNYPKIPDESGGYLYQNLDFAYLVELSNIDFALSRLALSLCGAIEHAVKVRTNSLFMGDDNVDIPDTCFRRVQRDVLGEHSNPYTDSLVAHRASEFHFYHLWELAPFSSHIELYRQYYSLTGSSPAPKEHMLFIVRKLRNAVSHGNCLLVDINRKAPSWNKETPQDDREVTNGALVMCGRNPRKSGKRASSLSSALQKLVVNNYAAMLLCHLEFVDSPKVLEYTVADVEKFISRINRNKDVYFGYNGTRTQQNYDVFMTLNALIELSNGYIRKAKEKISQLQGEQLISI